MKLIQAKSNGNMFPSLLSNFFDNDNLLTNSWFERGFDRSLPALNVRETPKGFEMELAAPGYKKGDFKVTLEEGVLTISAEKQEEKNGERNHFTRKEFAYESFTRSLRLPENSLPDKIEAKYEDGILNLTFPKRETTAPTEKKKIKVG